MNPGVPGTRPHRWPELDATRFIAVLGVMFVHFSPGWLATFGRWGDWGVEYFFVLSGFLITQILLGAREKYQSGKSTVLNESRHFFVRRILRLWPIYYAVLFFATAVNIPYARASFWWQVFFLSNHYIGHAGVWPQLLSHFWTLAIEQQFYVLWPWLIICLPTRALPALFAGLIVIGPLFRAYAVHLGWVPEIAANLYLPACADFFAWGGALAYWRRLHPIRTGRLGGPALAVALTGAAILFAQFYLQPTDPTPYARAAWAGVVCGVAAAAMILHCVAEQDSPVRWLLRWTPLVYLGTISYGIYILHNFTHWLGPRILHHLAPFSYFPWEAAHVAYLISLSIGLAALSWHFFEGPFNRIRGRW